MPLVQPVGAWPGGRHKVRGGRGVGAEVAGRGGGRGVEREGQGGEARHKGEADGGAEGQGSGAGRRVVPRVQLGLKRAGGRRGRGEGNDLEGGRIDRRGEQGGRCGGSLSADHQPQHGATAGRVDCLTLVLRSTQQACSTRAAPTNASWTSVPHLHSTPARVPTSLPPQASAISHSHAQSAHQAGSQAPVHPASQPHTASPAARIRACRRRPWPSRCLRS